MESGNYFYLLKEIYMKNILLVLLLMFCCAEVNGQILGENRPIVNYNCAPQYVVVNYQYIAVPVATIVPVIQYYPVVIWQNVVVEKREWMLTKRYEIVPMYQTLYVPARY